MTPVRRNRPSAIASRPSTPRISTRSVLTSSSTGTHSGSFIGENPTGEVISCMVLGMDRVEDGKIILHFATPNLFPFVMMGISAPALALV